MNAEMEDWQRKEEEKRVARELKDYKDVVKCKICGYCGIACWFGFTVFCYFNGGV